MKKTLIFILFYFICFQLNSFATIHLIVDANKTSVEKTRSQLFLSAKSDTSKQECVQIHLKDSTIIYGKVVSTDDTHLFFKPCDRENAPLSSISITKLSQVKDIHGKIIFNNEPKIMLRKLEKRGVFLANCSFGAICISVISLILTNILPKSAIIVRQGFIFAILTPLGNFLLIAFVLGLILSSLIGIVSLLMLKRSKNKVAKIKAWIGVAPILLIFLLYFFLSIFGH